MDLDLRILSSKDLTFESRKSLEGFANPNPNLFESAALLKAIKNSCWEKEERFLFFFSFLTEHSLSFLSSLLERTD